MNTRLRRLLPTTFLMILSALLIAGTAVAEPPKRAGMVGLSASWQSGHTDVLLPIWASEKLVVTPSLSVVHVTDFATDVGFALALRVIRGGTGTALPYFGGRFGVMHRAPDEGKALTDYLVGAMLGGECFLKDHFSVGVEAQFNAIISDENSFRFGNPNGTNVNSAAAVMATFYF
jgi:hypothetical protein